MKICLSVPLWGLCLQGLLLLLLLLLFSSHTLLHKVCWALQAPTLPLWTAGYPSSAGLSHGLSPALTNTEAGEDWAPTEAKRSHPSCPDFTADMVKLSASGVCNVKKTTNHFMPRPLSKMAVVVFRLPWICKSGSGDQCGGGGGLGQEERRTNLLQRSHLCPWKHSRSKKKKKTTKNH